MSTEVSRRTFLTAAASATAAGAAATDKPALLGGTPVRQGGFSPWPIVDQGDETALTSVLRSGKWNRTNEGRIQAFEKTWADRLGAKHCLAVANGTSALIATLAAMDIGPGDEVIVPPYTFVATINAVMIHHALPVFVDTDPETFQIDARKIDGAVTSQTRCLLPVHIGGAAADLDKVLEIGKRRSLPVVEDACQAHLGEWRGKRLGTVGQAGCYSFQASKNLNSGEGGAIVTSDTGLYEACLSYHTNGRGEGGFARTGANLRITEFQAAILSSQFTRVEAQSKRREENAAYLTKMLSQIPGISPAKLHDGCTRNALHLYMFRYNPEAFAGLPRARFLSAMAAEGVHCSGGYTPLDREPLIERAFQSRGFRRIYGENLLAKWRERTRLPENDRLCQEGVWLTQTTLLGTRQDMELIASAVERIRRWAPQLRS